MKVFIILGVWPNQIWTKSNIGQTFYWPYLLWTISNGPCLFWAIYNGSYLPWTIFFMDHIIWTEIETQTKMPNYLIFSEAKFFAQFDSSSNCEIFISCKLIFQTSNLVLRKCCSRSLSLNIYKFFFS